jgi:hypothetical protein
MTMLHMALTGMILTTVEPEITMTTSILRTVCPFDSEQIQALDDQLARLPYINNIDMPSHRLVWIEALCIASQLI